MTRELDKSTLQIDEIWCNRLPKSRERPEIQVLGIEWSCNLGFGRYSLYFEENGTKITADSEYMDKGEDKEFLEALLEKLLDKVEVEC